MQSTNETETSKHTSTAASPHTDLSSQLNSYGIATAKSPSDPSVNVTAGKDVDLEANPGNGHFEHSNHGKNIPIGNVYKLYTLKC